MSPLSDGLFGLSLSFAGPLQAEGDPALLVLLIAPELELRSDLRNLDSSSASKKEDTFLAKKQRRGRAVVVPDDLKRRLNEGLCPAGMQLWTGALQLGNVSRQWERYQWVFQLTRSPTPSPSSCASPPRISSTAITGTSEVSTSSEKGCALAMILAIRPSAPTNTMSSGM